MEINKKKHRPSKLTGLYKQREKLTKRRDTLRETVKKGQLELGKLNKRLKSIENELNSINTSDLVATDHFYKRYVERVEDIPQDQIYDKVVTPELIKMTDTLGNGTFPINNLMVVIQDRRLITVFTKESNIEI